MTTPAPLVLLMFYRRATLEAMEQQPVNQYPTQTPPTPTPQVPPTPPQGPEKFHKKPLSRKTIIVSIAAAIVVIVGTIGTLFALNVFGPKPYVATAEDNADAPAEPDTTKSYGACDVFTVDTLKTQLGTMGTRITEAKDAGIIQDVFGDSQVCVYPFTDNENFATTMFGRSNAISVEVYKFKDESSKASVIDVVRGDSSYEKLSSLLGDPVTFIAYDTTEGDTAYRYRELSVYSDMQFTKYSYNTTQDNNDINDALAKETLLRLADLATAQ